MVRRVAFVVRLVTFVPTFTPRLKASSLIRVDDVKGALVVGLKTRFGDGLMTLLDEARGKELK